MIPKILTSRGKCIKCKGPAKKLPPGARVAKGGGTHWRYCEKCFQGEAMAYLETEPGDSGLPSITEKR